VKLPHVKKYLVPRPDVTNKLKSGLGNIFFYIEVPQSLDFEATVINTYGQ